jgi:hypothetical protein
MSAALDDFIEEYRTLLRREGNVDPDGNADRLRAQLRDHRDRWAGNPEGRANWRAFEQFISSDLPLETRVREWAHVLGTGGRAQ